MSLIRNLRVGLHSALTVTGNLNVLRIIAVNYDLVTILNNDLIVCRAVVEAFCNRSVLKITLKLTISVHRILQGLSIMGCTDAQEATRRTAEGQRASGIVRIGLVGVFAAAGEHTGAGNCHCGEGGVLHKITTGESVRHDRSSFKGRYIQKALRRLLIK